MPDRLESLRIVDPVLSKLAQGYKHPAHLWPQILPVVPLSASLMRVPTFGKETFMAYNTAKPLRGPAARIEFGNNYATVGYDREALESGIDDEEYDEANPVLQLQTRRQNNLLKTMSLQLERAVGAMCQNAANYPVGNKVALTGNDQWNSGHVDGDPFVDIEAGREAVRGAVGVDPNLLALGPKIHSVLKMHPAVLAALYPNAPTQKGAATLAQLAELFEVEKVVVGKSITASADGVFSDIWGLIAMLAYVPPESEQDQETPAFGYTFRKQGHPITDKYRDEHSTTEVLRVQDYRRPMILGPNAAYLIADAIAPAS
ncbi:MAG: hypothetical protein P9M14_18035 [Candidatus Alcyoniella australis]|nr:hypothetical protein [Candidatus Alcyoniella australis]